MQTKYKTVLVDLDGIYFDVTERRKRIIIKNIPTGVGTVDVHTTNYVGKKQNKQTIIMSKLKLTWGTENDETRKVEADFRKAKKQGEADLYQAQNELDDAQAALEAMESAREGWSSAEIVSARRAVAEAEKAIAEISAVNEEFLA